MRFYWLKERKNSFHWFCFKKLQYKTPLFTDTRNVIKINKGVFTYMKATGIVRRIDDLGRVVIPKEIRRTMRIREGDPSHNSLTAFDKFYQAIHSVIERYKTKAE